MITNHKTKTIESLDNEKIKLVRKLCTSRKARKENNLFVIEGLRLCYDAVMSNINIHRTFYTQSAYEKFHNKINEIIKVSKESYLITESISQKISETSSPQGIFCVAEFRSTDQKRNFTSNEKIVILENIQDPSNLGTILRSAEAFGINNIILSHNCVDIYSPKVLRGSMGAIFRIDFISSPDLVSFIKELPMKTYATVPDKSAKKITDIDFSTGAALIIGNEGNGISNELLKSCDEKITIPMNGMAESLNAATAASIAMWEMIK